ncbi:MAG: PAS domain S-box protein [Elusimicrobia bacterium]|nr:PAS domain S-box protein [Elusimicrobiota bacterium]
MNKLTPTCSVPRERRAADRYITAQLAIAGVLAESPSLGVAITKVIRTVCQSMDWDAGALWEVRPTDRSLHRVQSWYAADRGLEQFLEPRFGSPAPMGIGLLGLVWASRQPAWIPDLAERRPGTYNPQAAAVGLHCHFGIPIRLGTNTFGILEFFSRSARQPDFVLLQMMSITGCQLGQFIKNRRAEEALKENREKYRLLFSGVSDAIILYDLASEEIEDANDAAISLYGYSKTEFLQRRLSDLSAQPRILPALVRSAHHERTVVIQRKRKDGSIFPVESTIGTLTWKDRIVGVRVERDITERRRSEELERLRERERLRREFVATVSHEFRTPVAAIKGFAETLQKGGLEDSRNRLQFVKIIEKHANRLSRLVEDLLELSALESGKRSMNPEAVRLAKFVRRFSRSIGPLVRRRRLSVRVDLPQEMRALADKTQLSQVLQNLLSNAVKFSRTGGRIVVSGKPLQHMVMLSVRDSGAGIPEEELPHIFERFNHCRKDRKQVEGTGLGLSIAKQIVEAHGGRIWAENIRGRGAAFHFTLPRPN